MPIPAGERAVLRRQRRRDVARRLHHHVLALSLALGTVFCSTASTPPLGRCCDLTASDGSIDCYCGTFAEGGVVSTVVVSGSTCTVTFTGDGGGGEQLKGYPPAAVTDCVNPVGN